MSPALQMIVQITGVSLLARFGSRLSNPGARTVIVVILIAMNLLPILAVWRGVVGVGDLFAIYWLENLVVMMATIVRIDTARGAYEGNVRSIKDPKVDVHSPKALRRYFVKHYGLFTLVHLVFTVILVVMTGGLQGSWAFWIVVPLVMVLGHLWALGVDWFGKGGLDLVSPARAVLAPYPRIFVLQIGLIAAVGIILFFGNSAALAVAIAFCVIKVVMDSVLNFAGPLRIELS